ncbi:hypothetical protein [uncultured Vagococcus sp.]|uniref:hypothetical protein n=1 Tax=uncultured Vagococcus sp. TaxID=189676 RepID=UPI0028D5305D|nr:hypothetical protein [uncultured Vagococcus sp.]
MIDEMNKKIRRINENIGVEVKLPDTTKPKLECYSMINLGIGTGFLLLGVATEMKGYLLIGSLALASGLFMRREAKKK